jgi:hypothetical protein
LLESQRNDCSLKMSSTGCVGEAMRGCEMKCVCCSKNSSIRLTLVICEFLRGISHADRLHLPYHWSANHIYTAFWQVVGTCKVGTDKCYVCCLERSEFYLYVKGNSQEPNSSF